MNFARFEFSEASGAPFLQSEFINILISEDLEKSKKRIFFNEVNIKSLLTFADEVELKIKE